MSLCGNLHTTVPDASTFLEKFNRVTFLEGVRMCHRYGKRYLVFIMVSWCLVFSGFSQTSTLLKYRSSFNQGWKFIKSDPGNAASGTNYNDASWSDVIIPHSPSNDAPDANSEQKYYAGICWYRKSFTLPATVQKAFLEFEAAMQVATVYLNGTQIGVHNNSGYTPFVMDISNQLVRSGSNVLAIRLNNAKSADIPPGWGNAGPDYNLYGGLHRSVWLHLKDSVHIPVYAQQIIPLPNTTATNSQLRVKTPVMNAAKNARNATVTVTLLSASDAPVVAMSVTHSIPAGSQYIFDTTSAAFTSSPWSPQAPNLYSVQTTVSVGGVVVDSTSEPCGFRSLSWSTSNGFSLNGTRLEIKGVCVHQAMGWIENAVSDWRYEHEVKVIKAMGCNSIRCSHYPRGRAFYDACDRLGMLVYPEVPTWGWSLVPNNACWTKLDSCTREMVISGRNHPCIYLWGLYNEPNGSNGPDFSPYISTMNTTAHALDSTRPTALATNGFANCSTVPDVIGLNYNTSISGNANGKNAANMPWFGCESRNPGTFGTRCFRGSREDLDTSDNQTGANDAVEWASFNFTNATSGHLAGGHFWCWKDYNSSWNPGAAQGIVDPFNVPKTLYYYIAKKWNSSYVTDYPRPGTATKIDLQVDTTSLPADSVNVFLLTAAMRDVNNHQISSDSCDVQFTLSDPAKGIIFGGNNVKALGGKAAAFLRTTKSPGTFTVTASYTCRTTIPSQSITLTTTAVPPEVYIREGTGTNRIPFAKALAGRLTVSSTSTGFVFKYPASSDGILTIVDIQGRMVFSSAVHTTTSVFVRRMFLGAGMYCALWNGADRQSVVRFSNM